VGTRETTSMLVKLCYRLTDKDKWSCLRELTNWNGSMWKPGNVGVLLLLRLNYTYKAMFKPTVRAVCLSVLLAVTALLLVSVSNTEPLEPWSWDGLNLKGRVKSMTHEKHYVNADKNPKGFSVNQTKARYEFDERGKVSKCIMWVTKDSTEVFLSTKYDDKGNQIEATFRTGSGDPSPVQYKYDDKGNLIERTGFRFGQIESNMKYDSKGREYAGYVCLPSLEDTTSVNGTSAHWAMKLASQLTSIYDNRNNIIEIRQLGPDGRRKTLNKYDRQNRLIKSDFYYPDSVMSGRIPNKYGKEGDKYMVSYNATPTGLKKVFYTNFNAHRNVIDESSIDSSGRKVHWRRTICDNKDNVIEEDTYDTTGTTITHKITYQYVYDTTGNWTEKATFSNGEKMSVENRKIEYY
jgi:hypothetical protein